MLGERLQMLQNALKLKPRDINAELKAHMNITLRIEKLSGKVILEKDADLVMRNLVRMLYQLMSNYLDYGVPSITITDTAGNARTGMITRASAHAPETAKYIWGCFNQGGVGIDTKGIVIGIGTTAPTRTDYALQSKIAHGSGVGQIYHNQQSCELLSDYTFRWTREFTNAGSNLAVTEAGMIYDTYIENAVYQFLHYRDVFTAVNVTTGNGIRVRYTWSL